MAIISLAEEIVNNFGTKDVLSFMESQLRLMKQIANKKETDKAFVLGQVSVGIGEVADIMTALRKKLDPKSAEEGSAPVVA